MAHVEPMDIDAIESDFDNKENTFHHSNVLSRTPCTEKGYEELDVSELNMKLRYSVTPASSPMSKSLTGPFLDNRTTTVDDCLNNFENSNLTRSLNSTLTKSEHMTKSKALPLQTLSSDPFDDSNRNSSIRRLIDPNDNNVTISISTNDIDDNLSLPSTSSSVAPTPEATTPTKETPKPEGSPILRGLKSVLSMFRSSQSPIPSADDKTLKQDVLSPVESRISTSHKVESEQETVLVSTPLAAERHKEGSASRSSPLKESVIFNDDLERELQWKDETTIIFKQEKIPVHKLFFRNPLTPESVNSQVLKGNVAEHNTSVEYMNISHDKSIVTDVAVADTVPNIISTNIEETGVVESDNEFLDCETTFSKNESCTSDLRLEMENKTHILQNLSVDLTEKVLTADIEDSKFKNVMNISECIQPEDVYIKPLEKPSIAEFNKTYSSTSKIIEATMEFLKNESFNNINDNIFKPTNTLSLSNNVNLQNEAQILSQDLLYNIDVTRAIDDEIISNNDKSFDVIETNSNAAESLVDNSSVKERQEMSINIEIEDSLSVSEKRELSKIDNLPDVCPITLTNVNCPEDADSHSTYEMKVDYYSDQILAHSNVSSKNEDVNVMVKSGISDDTFDTIEVVDTVIVETNSQEQSKSDKSKSTQVDNVLPVNNNALTKCLYSSYESVTNAKDADMSITAQTKNDNEVFLNVSCGVSSSASIIKAKSQLDSIEGSFSQKVNLNEIIEKDDKPTSDVILNTTIDNVLCVDNDRDISEMTVTSNIAVLSVNNERDISEMTVTNNIAVINPPPSDILLLSKNETEQDIAERENIIAKNTSTFDKGHDVSTTINETASITNLEDRHIMNTENSEPKVTKTLSIDINNENDTDTVASVNKVDLSESNGHIIQNQCGLVQETKSEFLKDGTIAMSIVNMTQSDDNIKDEAIDLQNADNTVNIEKGVSNEIDNKEIFENKVFNNNCETILKQNTDITQNIYNKSNIKFAENVSSTEKTTKSETANDVEKNMELHRIIVDKGIDQDNELGISVEEAYEEIITSANNSPYVSVADLALDMKSNSQLTESSHQDILQNIDNSFASKTNIVPSPPISPKIVSKGYNFNFDDIDDPFTTKTKIRMSPTPDIPDHSCASSSKEFGKSEDHTKKIINRRKSQPERIKVTQKKNFNSRFGGQLFNKENLTKNDIMNQNLSTQQDNILDNASSPSETQYISELKFEDPVKVTGENFKADCKSTYENGDDICESRTFCSNSTPNFIQQEEIVPSDTESKDLDQTIVVSVEKSTSSSEQYFSLGTSSGESVNCMNHSKNVFNLPEIDDMNFNPFATKSKMRMSPPIIHNTTNVIEDKICDTVSKLTLEPKVDNNITLTKDVDVGDGCKFNEITATDCSQNINNANCSSNSTNDKNDTVKEILTEDEDTIEGPFLDADDLKDIEKLTHLEVENDMMNFDEVHPQEKDFNSENGELFIDADAFEFLLNKNKSSTVLDSGKESLFLKFDPLFAKRISSDGVLAALNKVQKRQSTPKKLTSCTQRDILIKNSVPGPSNDSYVPIEEYNDDMSSTVTKPMMVVNPAVSSIVGSRRSTPSKINRQSLTFTSPAMAVIDRLLSLSGNSSHLNHDTSIPQYSETDLAITQLRELLAEKEIHVHNLRSESKELKGRLTALEGQLRSLEAESKDRLNKINELNERLSEKTKINRSMATVVEEYERTIASLIAESERDRKRNAEERMKLIKERDEQTAHLASMEVSFSDLHSKYEKSKQIIMSCKANEDTYKKSIREFEENFMKMQNNYELLKQHATSKLNYANQELEKMNRAHEAEVLKLNAMIKRKELHITSLEETLTQKTKANEELTAICDELINKVG